MIGFSRFFFIGLIFMLSFLKINAQNDFKHTWIFTNTFMNLDITQPKINIGIERQFNDSKRISIASNIYYYNWWYEEPTSGLAFDIDYKSDFKNSNSTYYSFGAKIGYINYDTYVTYSSGDYEDTLTGKYIEPINIEKTIGEFNFKIGKRIEQEKLLIDMFIGCGIRYRNTLHHGKTNPEHEIYKKGFTIQDIKNTEGKFIFPTLKLGVLIGLKI
mgnify:CR=1 FL=1